ncbi:MAG: hypothetical protein ABEJ93_01780 [Candidatus Nanohalobium sp.]
MNRKGQYVSMLAVVALLFISGGSLFSSLFAQQTFASHINYYSQDIGNMMQAETKKEFFNYTLRKETNFTENNVALSMEGRYNWDSLSDVPSYSNFKDDFSDKLSNKMKDKKFVRNCGEPGITINSVNQNVIEMTLSNNNLTCGTSGSYTQIPLGYNQNQPQLQIKNNKNRFLKIAELALRIPDHIKGDPAIPDDLEEKGSASGNLNDPTVSDPTEKSDVKEDAKDEAYNDAKDAVSGLGKDVISDFDKNGKDWATIDISASIPSKDSDQFSKVSSNLDPNGWKFTCSSAQNLCGNLPPNAPSSYCPCGKFFPTYSYTAKYNVHEIHFTVTVEDSENEIRTKEGLEHTKMKIKYTVDS